ncbi:hypothetical protein ACFVWP_46915 [Streptomyces sp. NPDC058175]|uniref:hypothetical protein n=1 Tax=Streptomyces sp. NPDC058175 TaxID=3346367 RepID=UPI0036E49150
MPSRPELRLVGETTPRPAGPPFDLTKALAELADYLHEHHRPAPRLRLIRTDETTERKANP